MSCCLPGYCFDAVLVWCVVSGPSATRWRFLFEVLAACLPHFSFEGEQSVSAVTERKVVALVNLIFRYMGQHAEHPTHAVTFPTETCRNLRTLPRLWCRDSGNRSTSIPCTRRDASDQHRVDGRVFLLAAVPALLDWFWRLQGRSPRGRKPRCARGCFVVSGRSCLARLLG